jgi:hypothetical protein
VDFPNGGSAGDYVDILGFAHYWNPDRNNWCVNEERDEYWDELLVSAAEGVKRLETELASTREQIEKNTKNIDVNTERLNIEGTQVMTVDEMINFNPLSDDGKSFLAGYLDQPSRYVVTAKTSDGRKVNVGTLEVLSDVSSQVYTQKFTTHYILNADGTFDNARQDVEKLFIYYRSFSITEGYPTSWRELSATITGTLLSREVLLSEEEFESLENIDENKIYYIYEQQ